MYDSSWVEMRSSSDEWNPLLVIYVPGMVWTLGTGYLSVGAVHLEHVGRGEFIAMISHGGAPERSPFFPGLLTSPRVGLKNLCYASRFLVCGTARPLERKVDISIYENSSKQKTQYFPQAFSLTIFYLVFPENNPGLEEMDGNVK